MARHLRWACARARLFAGQQPMRPTVVQPPPARRRDLLIDGVAQQLVARTRGHHRSRRVIRSEGPRWRPHLGRRWATGRARHQPAAGQRRRRSRRGGAPAPRGGRASRAPIHAGSERSRPRRVRARERSPSRAARCPRPARPRVRHRARSGGAARRTRAAPASGRQRPEVKLAAEQASRPQSLLEPIGVGAARAARVA